MSKIYNILREFDFMSKIIQIKIPDWMDVRDIQRDIQRMVVLKSIEKFGSEVSEDEID